MKTPTIFKNSNKKFVPGHLLTFMIGVLIFLGFAKLAYADVGPKSYLHFIFEYNIEKIPIIEARLIHCDDVECKNGILQEYGSFECEANTCTSIGGFYTDYQKLVITFEDKIRESNVFERKSYYGAKYLVTVEEDELYVEDVSGWSEFLDPWYIMFAFFFLLILVLTLAIELIVAGVYLKIIKAREIIRQLGWVIVANIISLSIIWFLSGSLVDTILILEIFVVIFETFFLYWVNRKRGLTFVHAGILSVIMNTVSYLIGLAIIPL